MTKDKILNLRFYYRGKNIDTALEERDIKNKFIIGSDKNIQWQILDRTFPKKHVLIRKVKDGYKIILRKGMQVTVKKGGEVLTEATLRSQNKLKKNELLIDEDSTGYVTCARYWCIAYEFVVPKKKIITAEDKIIINRYHRRPPLTSDERLGRNLLILVIIMMISIALIFENFYTPPVFERRLSHRVQIQPVQPQPEETLVFDERIEEEVPEDLEEAETIETPRGAASVLGFDPGATEGPVVQVPSDPVRLIYGEQIVASGGGWVGTDTEVTAGRGGRVGSGFDTEAQPSMRTPGEIFKGDIDTARRMGMRDIDPSLIGGISDDNSYTQITSAEELEALVRAKQRALSAGIQTVDESEIEAVAPEIRDRVINIRQYIEPSLRQLHELFAQESQVRNIYGSLQITLYFRPNGHIEAVSLEPRPGSFFTDSFMARATEIMRQWRVPTTRQLPAYSFQIRFVRN